MKILAAIDGSDAAFHALRSACRIAKSTFSSVVTFYVNKGEEYTADQTGWLSLTEKLADEFESLGHEVIQKAYAIGRQFEVPTEGIMSYGLPPAEILKYAGEHGIVKLIAMGHSSKGKGAQEFVESTTRSVVSASRVPVFVSSAETDIRRILIAVDNSETTKRVAAFGAKLAASLSAEPGIVAFVPDMEAMISEYRLIAEVPNIEKQLEISEKELKKLLDSAVETTQKILSTARVSPSDVIKVNYADEMISEAARYDALVLGISGSSSGKINRIANKLLDSHTVNTFFVQ